MNNLLLFAGTTEGREVASYLSGSNSEVYVCVATEYGKTQIAECDNIHVLAGRLTKEEMEALSKERNIGIVIDATHPFAKVVSENIKNMCGILHLPYIRVLRNEAAKDLPAVYVSDMQEAAEYLKKTEGNILVTTGSKELSPYLAIPDCHKRCFVRVLSTAEAVEACISHGFEGTHLIAMQGPFSYEMNLALLSHIDAKYLVTKESGDTGGYDEKIQAAVEAGVVPVVIGRPKENGYTLKELYAMLEETYQIEPRRIITLAGIGPGHVSMMTQEVRERIKDADLLIGADRMLDAVKTEGQKVYTQYRAGEIRSYIFGHPQFRRIVIVLSGDVSFYSGAKKLLEVMNPKWDVTVLPGISSVSYLAAKLHVSLEETPFLSVHGKECNPIDHLREHGQIFLLISSGKEVQNFLETLCELGYEHARISVGSRLSYKEEVILEGTAEELKVEEFHPLSVVFAAVEKEKEKRSCLTGIPDASFLRGNVPMTKQDVRAVILSRMQISKDAVIYDIGAGTGSVSIEMAMHALDGKVFAVERKEEGADLIRKNKRMFHVSNVEVVVGEAPDVMSGLPAPTHAFIGGSGHKLVPIIEAVREKNEKARIVVSAITLNTVAECMAYLDRHKELHPQIVEIQVSEAREIGSYQMMTGQNPIYIFAF